MTGAPSAVAPSPPVGIDPDDLRRIRGAVARIPGADAAAVAATPLPGGLTNRNYRVSGATARPVVVRLSEPSALLAIDRVAEHASSQAAATTGVAPAVRAWAPELGALVLEWIDGQTFGAADLDDSATLGRLAATCRALHAGPRFPTDFDMFAVQRRYLDLVLAGGFRLPASYRDLAPSVAVIEAALAAHPEPTVPCHNDLLPANIMAADGRLWLIDFEYAGNGDPCFELGNICSEARLGPDRLAELVAAYFGTASPRRVARTALFALMSDYGWTLWASIQAATSDLDFDFWAWGLAKYERAVEAFGSPDLARLITEVREP